MPQTLLFGEEVISRSHAVLLSIFLAVKRLHCVFHDVLTGKLRNKINVFSGFKEFKFIGILLLYLVHVS